jgi:hypothetical protein
MDKREALKSMLNNVINDNTDHAALDLHNYLTVKMREVSGLAQVAPVATPQTNENTESDDDILGESLEDDVKVIIDEIVSELAGKGIRTSARAVRSLMVGGGNAGDSLVAKLEDKFDFDSAGGWEENKKFFNDIGVTKAKYNKLVKAGE